MATNWAGRIPRTAGDNDRTAIVNHIIGMALNTTESFLGETVHRSNNSFRYLARTRRNWSSRWFYRHNYRYWHWLVHSYLWAKYDGPNDKAEVWYVGDLSGIITIPASDNGYGLSGWTLFGPGVPGVPDGGTTAMLLGAALGALGMARRFLTS